MTSREDFEAFFREADTDGSGDLSLEELTAILKKKGYKGSDSTIKEIFSKMDMTKDNKISMDEYLLGMGIVPNQDHLDAAMRRLFQSFDKDGNGEIDKDELKGIFKEMGKQFTDQQMDRMIGLVDKDNSKTINYEEFMAYFWNEEKK